MLWVIDCVGLFIRRFEHGHHSAVVVFHEVSSANSLVAELGCMAAKPLLYPLHDVLELRLVFVVVIVVMQVGDREP